MGIITVIGSLNMDLVVRTPRAPKAGETLAGSSFHLIPGGKGANQAVAAARAGAQTRMIGCIGNDAFAPVLLDSLNAAGVNTSQISSLEGVSTGTATIILEDSGENRIIIVPGANGKVSVDSIQQRWEGIRDSTLVLLQHEIPLETVHYVLDRAHAEGMLSVLNPAPVYPVPEGLLPKIDILILNEGESGVLTGMDVSSREAAQAAAINLVKRGVKTAIITLGAQGALLHDGSQTLYQPAFPVTVVDTTAAGDTFTGGYAAEIARGKPQVEALRYATAASAIAVTRLGAQTSIPNHDEVVGFLSKTIL